MSTDTRTLETTSPSGGLSRRSALGRAGAVGAGAALLASGLLSPPGAGAAEAGGAAATAARSSTGVAPGLPSAKAVLAQDRRLVDYEILELAALLREGETTSVAITQAYIDRILDFNGPFETYGTTLGYNAFVRIDAAAALDQAKAADARLAREGNDAPFLCGIPIGAKDSVGVKGFTAQNGTSAFAGNVVVEDGPVVARLRALGVVFLGITICSAFSGSITGTFAGNAWNRNFFPGGSSQGSGVAAVARLAAAAIGEETGGSIIFPSAANGASGIKPSLGLCSVAGVMPLSPAVDVIGPISRSMRDSSLLLNAMLGPDPTNDPQTTIQPTPFPELPITTRPGAKPLAGLRIGVPQLDFLSNQTSATTQAQSPQAQYSAENRAAFDRFRTELEGMGATVVNFPGLDLRDAASNPYFSSPDVLETVDGSPVSPSGAVVGSNRADIRYVEAVADFAKTQPDAAQATLLTNYGRRAGGTTSTTVPRTYEDAAKFNAGISSGARRQGEVRRRQFAANYEAALDADRIDFMLVMNFGTKIGPRATGSTTGVRFRSYYQVPNALAWPMVSFPIAYSDDADGLPISAQFWGPRFSEPEIVQAAIDYQARFSQYHTAAPPDPAAPIPRGAAGRRAQSPNASAAEDPLLSNDPLIAEAALPDAFRP